MNLNNNETFDLHLYIGIKYYFRLIRDDPNILRTSLRVHVVNENNSKTTAQIVSFQTKYNENTLRGKVVEQEVIFDSQI